MAALKSASCGRNGCGLIQVFAGKVNPFLLRRSMTEADISVGNPVAGTVFL
jgi:hypothetical protein